MYIVYRCMQCGLIIIVDKEQMEELAKLGRYMTCLFGHKHLEVAGRYDDLLECMEKQHVYKRERGRVRQIK